MRSFYKNAFSTTNDVGIIWPEKGAAPIILVIYFTQKQKQAAPRNDIIAEATKYVVEALF